MSHTKPLKNNVFETGRIVTFFVSHFILDVYSGFLAPLLILLIEKEVDIRVAIKGGKI